MTAPAPGADRSPAGGPTLGRALGRWDLTAIGVNQVIGGAIFLIPAQVAGLIGGWSVPAMLLAGLASLLVALSFAEVSSRFEGTGGPYLFTRAAFGPFVAFEVGWMQWFTRATSQASVANGIALALGYYWPAMTSGVGRAALLVGLTLVLAWINYRGIRQSAWTVDALTIGKLLPLAIFISVGLFVLDPVRLRDLPPVTPAQASAAALLLIFVFGGYEVVPVPAGEAQDPRRHVPFALVMTIVIVTVIFTAGQAVATGVLPDVAQSRTPLAEASMLMLGVAGALMMSAGSVTAMTGNNMGQVLSGSRMLFALAEHGQLPRWFGRVHPVHRTPSNAVLFTSVVALVLMLSGSFVVLATVSAVARLVIYTGTCAATLALRRRDRLARGAGSGDPGAPDAIPVKPAAFTTPLGPAIPVLALVISIAILAGASRDQLLGGAAALGAGALLYFVSGNAEGRRREGRIR